MDGTHCAVLRPERARQETDPARNNAAHVPHAELVRSLGEGIEDAIYDSYAMKRFLKIDFSIERTPNATTLLHFRHLLEKYDITRKMFDEVKERLDNAGLIMHGGTIVDATIIHLVDCDYPLFISDSLQEWIW